MWPFKKKKINCEDCGFLYSHSEFPRNRCYRGEKIFEFKEKPLGNGPGIMVAEVKNYPQFCNLYQKRIPGLTPEGHLEHKLYKGPGVTLSKWAIGIAIIATAISFYAANNRSPILGIERFDYYDGEKPKLEELNRKLSNGNYTILYTRDLNINAPGGLGDKHIVVLGKIKK